MSYEKNRSLPGRTKNLGTFEFITSTGKPKRHDSEDLRKIRAHLGRRYHRKTSATYTPKTSYPALRPRAVSCSTSTRSSLRFYDTTESQLHRSFHDCNLYQDGDGLCSLCAGLGVESLDDLESNKATASNDTEALRSRNVAQLIRTTIDSKMSDPFNSACVSLSPEATFLANHWLTALVKTTMRSTPGPKLFTNGLSDPLLMHSILSLAASHYLLEGGMKPKIEVELYNQRGAVILLLNKDLHDPTKRNGNSVITAIATLASHEIMQDRPRVVEAHFAAMKILISERGGFKGLGLRDTLSRRIAWVYIFYCAVSCTPLNFTPFKSVVPVIDHIWGKDDKWYAQNGALRGYASTCLDEISILVTSLNNISRQINSRRSKPSWEELLSYVDNVTLLERHITILMTQKLDTVLLSSTESALEVTFLNFSQPFYLSALLFLLTVFREFPLATRVFTRLVKRLKDMFIDEGVLSLPSDLSHSLASAGGLGSSHETIYNRALIWALFVGTATANGRPVERAWFLERLGDICTVLNIESWSQVVEILRHTAWVPSLCGRVWKGIWTEISPGH